MVSKKLSFEKPMDRFSEQHIEKLLEALREIQPPEDSLLRAKNIVMAEVRRGVPEPQAVPIRLKLHFRLAPVLISLVLVVALGGGTALAAQNDLPGELLYGVKIATERVTVALAPSPKKRIELETLFAVRRAEEVKALVKKIEQAPAEEKPKLEQEAAVAAEWVEVQVLRAKSEAVGPESAPVLDAQLIKLEKVLDETTQEPKLETRTKERIEKLKMKIRSPISSPSPLPSPIEGEGAPMMIPSPPVGEGQGEGEWVTPIKSRPIEPEDLSPYFVPTLPERQIEIAPSPQSSPTSGEGIIAPPPIEVESLIKLQEVQPLPDRTLVERELVAARELFEAMSSQGTSRRALEPALELIVNADFELARGQIKEAQIDIRAAMAILEQIKAGLDSKF